MENRNEEIRRANRKALPKFITIVILACLVGGVIGFCAAFFGLDAMTEAFHSAGAVFSCRVAPLAAGGMRCSGVGCLPAHVLDQ